jgi:hypothetical protein
LQVPCLSFCLSVRRIPSVLPPFFSFIPGIPSICVIDT